jgi:hypothetical protein
MPNLASPQQRMSPTTTNARPARIPLLAIVSLFLISNHTIYAQLTGQDGANTSVPAKPQDETSPKASTPSPLPNRGLLALSPYYLAGLSTQAFNFSGSPASDAFKSSGTFRVLGASTAGLAVPFEQAEASCRALQGGRGLAVASTLQRKKALDASISASMVRVLAIKSYTSESAPAHVGFPFS